MFHHKAEDNTDFVYSHSIIWLILAFQAGAINTGALIAGHRFASHVTGFASHFGTEFALGNWSAALGMVSVPMFFLAGAMISGFLIDHRIVTGRRPNYTFPFFYMAVILLIVSFAGWLGYFGNFGDLMEVEKDYSLVALLCLCCGLQNAMVTTVSGAIVRTTHLTGITTDLGIGLVRAFSSLTSKRSARHEARNNWLRIGIIGFFTAGSAIGAFGFFSYQYFGFLLPAMISTGLWVYSLTISK